MLYHQFDTDLLKCIFPLHILIVCLICGFAQCQVSGSTAAGGPSTSSGAAADSEEVSDVDDDDDELDMDELNELEASLSKTSIQIREPGIEAS